MQIKETYLNRTKGYIFGESDWYEPFTDNRGRLFRDMQREYGRCTSRVYVDTDSGPRAVGWVFEKRMQYEDARRPSDTYVREVWVHVQDDAAPEQAEEV